MEHPTAELDYIEWNGARAIQVRRPVIAETPWLFMVDGREALRWMCSPVRLHCLALGFLLNEGIIAAPADLRELRVYLDEHRVHVVLPAAGIDRLYHMHTCPDAGGTIVARLARPVVLPDRRTVTSGCGGGISFDDLRRPYPPLECAAQISASQLIGLMRELNYQAELYRQSRGVHTSALSDGERLLLVEEDVGRHNTIDKIRGAAALQGIATRGRILLSSGRISTEMIGKARKMETPIVCSRTSPTSASVRLARAWNITLVGYARAPQLRVYAGEERIVWK